ncbi:type II toxin-antitoxin system HicB family antitoxin [Candidatus Magnetomonas plexicatena]|uniref:type II toxin-antitoxin system HicB family antitoxin n=1 Tax=Candidatus Magnetomonas plexicatena TaxID=2552947 RepID=UPI001102C1D4|nr:type II toxin-antitoxin system HicB family antitoxin [Nitrospirales bacterium LBB_01]
MESPVIINKTEYGCDANCPLLRGCHSQGDTLEEAQENIKDAISTYLEMVEFELRDKSVYKISVPVENAFH